MFWKTYGLHIAWTIGLFATVGSLFFSEILKFTPCVLCWYQRVFMYPLVFLLTVGILRKDRGVYSYVLPLSIVGFCIAIYHNLLYYHILPEAVSPCVKGVSCTAKQLDLFGFLTIPLLSLGAFAIITICMTLYTKYTTGK